MANRVKRVTNIEFEHSPGRGDPRYLDNRSAADAFIEHTTPTCGRGFISIETKYHENLAGKNSSHKPRYDEVATSSGAFAPKQLALLRTGRLQQIWLDHLLALATRAEDGWDTCLFVLLYPARNLPCENAGQRYTQCLSDHGLRTFDARTLESVHHVITHLTDASWPTDFHRRYLDFDRADDVLSQDVHA